MTNAELDAMRAVVRLSRIADEIAGSLKRIADSLEKACVAGASKAGDGAEENGEKENDTEED